MNYRLIPFAAGLALTFSLPAQGATPLTSGFRHSSNTPAMAFDAARGRLLVATEFDGGTLWEWNGVAWGKQFARPPQRAWQMVYDAFRQRVFVFELPINGAPQPMHEYDGHSMRNRGIAPAMLSIVADTARGRLVGIGYGQTHEWDGTNWQQVAIGSSPPAGALPYSGNLAYDAARGRAVALTSAAPGGPGITWEWDGTLWTQTPVAATPVGTLVFDPARSEVLCVRAAAAQAWNGTTWTPRPSPGSPWDSGQQQLASDPLTGRVYRLALNNYEHGQISAYDGTGWTVACLGPHPERAEASPTFDVARGRVVLFGGLDPASALVPSLHEWDGVRWHDRSAVAGPTPRWGHAQVYDSLRGETVVIGGRTTAGNVGDAWAWNGTTWRQLPGSLPAPRYAAAATYDSVRDRIVLLGGRDASGLRNDHLEHDGSNWIQILAATPFAPHVQGALGYDPNRQRLVFQTYGSFTGVTWEWDGVAWTSGATTGPGIRSRALLWIPARQRLEVLARSSTSLSATSLFAYDGTAWTGALVDPNHEGAYAQPVYDPARDLMLDYRGRSLVGFTAQAATVADFGTPCGGNATVTSLGAFGVPRPGDAAFHLDVRAEAALRPAVLGFAFAQGNQPLGNGCTFLLQNPIASVVWFTDANGFLQVPLALPNQLALRGLQFFAQAAVLDPASPGSLAMSQGLRLVVGD